MTVRNVVPSTDNAQDLGKTDARWQDVYLAGDITDGTNAASAAEIVSGLSDSRTPTAHKTTHATGGADALSASDIGAEEAGAAATVAGNLTSHTENTSNPHSVTYTQAGAPALAHGHGGTSDGSKLSQANTHESADTDSATSALHHTIGTGANNAAAGNHTHSGLVPSGGTDGQVLAKASNDDYDTEWAICGGGDMLSGLVNAEVTIDSAATMTVGKMHLVTDSGTPVNYTLTLPAVSGNTGKFIGIRVSAAATKLFTVDGDGSEVIWTIGGAVANRIYVAGESAVFLCDGTRWQVIHETLRMLSFHAHQTNAQSISASTATKVTLDTERFDIGGCFDSTTNNRFTPTAPGIYSFGCAVSIASISADKNVWCGIRINGSTTYWSQAQSISVNGMNPSAAGSLLFALNGTSDYVDLVVYHSDTGAKNTMVDTGQRCWLFGHRVCRETS